MTAVSSAVENTAEPVPARTAWWILLAGLLGVVASLTLTAEKIELLRDPSYVPSCNLNPILACGSVMAAPEASILGFPNSLFGIVAFTVVLVAGVLSVTKVALPQWFWSGIALGILAGAGYVHWLIFESLYRIGALCPYCMAVWVITMTTLVVTGALALRPALQTREGRGWDLARVVYRWRWSILALWFTAVLLLILVRFWSYWSTVL